MTKLNQIVSVEKGVKNRIQTAVTELYKEAQHPALFEGFNKKYKPNEEGGETFPSENKKVQKTAHDVLQQAASSLTEIFDVTASKDFANCHALADVVVDGKVLLSKVPATYLLFLEKQLTDMHTLVAALPTLDSAETWAWDQNANLFKTEPTTTGRTKKVQKALVLYPHSDKHPAQTQLITEDVNIGTWEQTKFSGAIPANNKTQLLAKLETLSKAVKFAREEANTVDAPTQSVGTKVFTWLLGA